MSKTESLLSEKLLLLSTKFFTLCKMVKSNFYYLATQVAYE